MAELLCGVDLGGTKVLVALVDDSGNVLRTLAIRDHRSLSEDETIRRISEVVQALVAEQGVAVADLQGVGVGTSGHVDNRRGVVVTNSNLPGFTDYPLQKRIQEHLAVPVTVDNDANAQAYAEYSFGAGRDATNMIFVTVSTGIGAGIVMNSRLYRGTTGSAGEIGHTIVNPHSPIRCGCGNYGCLMSHACGLSIPEVVKQKIAKPGCVTDIDITNLSDAEINGELIKEGLDTGDPLCREIVLEYADYLAIGLYNLFQLFNPGLFVLGGGLTEWGPVYLNRIRKRFYELALHMMHERIQVRTSEIGAEAAVIGAAALVLEPDT
jgi:glucokinase